MDIQSKTRSIGQSITYGYHHFTKHTVEKLYSNRHSLDWANQPDPFLKYKGCKKVSLSEKIVKTEKTLDKSIESFLNYLTQEGEESDFSSLDFECFISNLLFYSVAISAWKQIKGTDHKWALRVNASSGNLHPTETTLIVDEGLSSTIAAGVYHYRADEHALEVRHDKNMLPDLWQALGFKSPPPPVLVCLSSIFWREAWKYQDRAYRYCQLDLGHALSSVSLAASSLDYRPYVVSLFPDRQVSELLGFSASFDHPFAFIALFPQQADFIIERDETTIAFPERKFEYLGEPSKISEDRIRYDSIDEVHAATRYSESDCRKVLSEFANSEALRCDNPGTIEPAGDVLSLAASFREAFSRVEYGNTHSVVRTRRSAVDMDGKTAMDKEEFLSILALSLNGYPGDYQKPVSLKGGKFDTESSFNLINLYFYVHRVEGIDTGLYYYCRRKRTLTPLTFHDQREIAKLSSCFQDIASDGAFSISMIADLNTAYQLFFEKGYNLVHNEAGYLGQMFYLATTAIGYESTGIGCFIDDIINEYLVLNEGHEVVYNFTVGRAVVDDRLTTLPSYRFIS